MNWRSSLSPWMVDIFLESNRCPMMVSVFIPTQFSSCICHSRCHQSSCHGIKCHISVWFYTVSVFTSLILCCHLNRSRLISIDFWGSSSVFLHLWDSCGKWIRTIDSMLQFWWSIISLYPLQSHENSICSLILLCLHCPNLSSFLSVYLERLITNSVLRLDSTSHWLLCAF